MRSFSNLDEVLNSLLVCEVLVKVVFEMLNEVHVLLDEVKSSDSWESESVIIKFPGVNISSWRFAFFQEFIIDFESFSVMRFLKLS